MLRRGNRVRPEKLVQNCDPHERVCALRQVESGEVLMKLERIRCTPWMNFISCGRSRPGNEVKVRISKSGVERAQTAGSDAAAVS
jgi:hypothetical protein